MFFKYKRNRIKKRLYKSLEQPNIYLNIYEELEKLYFSYKSPKYKPELINSMLEVYIQSKGLIKIEKIYEVIDMQKEIKEDNKVVYRLKHNYQELDRKMLQLQELVIKYVRDNRFMDRKSKFDINQRISTNKQQKVRSTINVTK